MKTELEKCMAGEWYDCHDPVFVEFKAKARQLLSQYNGIPYENKRERYLLLQDLFGSIGTNVSVKALWSARAVLSLKTFRPTVWQ